MANEGGTKVEARAEARAGAERHRPMVLKEAYPLRPAFSYAAIKRDPITEEIVYEVVEPTLTEHEKKLLEKLKEKLLDELKVDLDSFENREKAEEFLMKESERAGFGGLKIQRTPMGTLITLQIERPGLIIGRGGKRIKEITEFIENKFQVDIDYIKSFFHPKQYYFHLFLLF